MKELILIGMKNERGVMKKTMIIAIGLLIGYAAAGYHERGWIDWPGLCVVALLLIPALYYVRGTKK